MKKLYAACKGFKEGEFEVGVADIVKETDKFYSITGGGSAFWWAGRIPKLGKTKGMDAQASETRAGALNNLLNEINKEITTETLKLRRLKDVETAIITELNKEVTE